MKNIFAIYEFQISMDFCLSKKEKRKIKEKFQTFCQLTFSGFSKNDKYLYLILMKISIHVSSRYLKSIVFCFPFVDLITCRFHNIQLCCCFVKLIGLKH